MDDHEYTRRIEVLRVVDTGRRRRWTDEEKLRIVTESHCAGANLSDVARRHEISRAQLYEWRYRHRLGLLVGGPSSFTQLTCTPERDHAEEPPVFGMTVGTAAPTALTVELGGRYRVRHGPLGVSGKAQSR